jgi:hypothetical protein
VLSILVLVFLFLWNNESEKSESKLNSIIISERNPMNFSSSLPDWVDAGPTDFAGIYYGWDNYYTFDYHYQLSNNRIHYLIGDASLPENDGQYILLTIPDAQLCSEGDTIIIALETSWTPTYTSEDTLYAYIFEDSAETSLFNLIFAYHEINNDSPDVKLRIVVNSGVKRWAMFGGYIDP